MKFKFNWLDLIVAIVLLGYGFERGGIIMLLAVIALLLYLIVRFQFASVKPNFSLKTEVFVVEEDSNNKYPSSSEIYLDVDCQRRASVGHFLLYSRFDTNFAKSVYEYRIDGTDVLYRLIDHEQHDVRDGVVQESAIREFYKDKTWSWLDVDEKINSRKSEVEWHSLVSWGFNGFKYFVLSKKLPRPDARRFFRQELERLRVGTAAFFKEAGKYGLEQDPESLERLRVAEGRTKPSNEDYKKLCDSCSSFGIDQLEFSWGKNLTAQLEKLLGEY